LFPKVLVTGIRQKVSPHDITFLKKKTFTHCDYSRGIHRRAVIICFQTRSEILAATNLKIVSKWEKLRQSGWQHRTWN